MESTIGWGILAMLAITIANLIITGVATKRVRKNAERGENNHDYIVRQNGRITDTESHMHALRERYEAWEATQHKKAWEQGVEFGKLQGREELRRELEAREDKSKKDWANAFKIWVDHPTPKITVTKPKKTTKKKAKV